MSEGPSMESGGDDEPISYLALAVGTPVLSSSGQEFGRVEHVLQIPELDLFDGVAVKTRRGLRFVDRDQIETITASAVRCLLSDEEVSHLEPPSGPPARRVDVASDEGPSLTAWFGRHFGRPHWKDLDS